MNLDYSNPEENILFAAFENDLKDHNGNEFTVVGSAPIFREDPVIGKYMEVPKNSYLAMQNSAFAVGTGDFTLDFWAYSIGKHCAVSTTTRTNGISIYPYPSYAGYPRQCAFLGTVGQGEFINLPEMKSMEWAHYALVRKDGVCYAFVNGLLQGTATSSRSITSTEMAINNDLGNNSAGTMYDLNNYYKAVRLCDFARWTEDFELPNPNQEAKPKIFIPLAVDEQVELLANTWPLSSNLPNFVWLSGNDSIASVDQDGVVTANSPGKTNIYVQKEDGSWTAFARVKVLGEPGEEDDVKLSVLVGVGETRQLLSELEAEDEQIDVVWKSADTAIASVNQSGEVTGISEGLATITINDENDEVLDSIYVTVLEKNR